MPYVGGEWKNEDDPSDNSLADWMNIASAIFVFGAIVVFIKVIFF